MRSHRRDFRRRQPRGPFAGLGLGDPGYRLRPGASGLDPMETYAECGRVLGILLKSAFSGRLGRFPVASFFVLAGLVQIVLFRITVGWDALFRLTLFWNPWVLGFWLTVSAFFLYAVRSCLSADYRRRNEQRGRDSA